MNADMTEVYLFFRKQYRFYQFCIHEGGQGHNDFRLASCTRRPPRFQAAQSSQSLLPVPHRRFDNESEASDRGEERGGEARAAARDQAGGLPVPVPGASGAGAKRSEFLYRLFEAPGFFLQTCCCRVQCFQDNIVQNPNFLQ